MPSQIIPMFPDSGTDAAKLQQIPVSTVDPTNGQTLVYNSTTRQYEPATPGGGTWGSITGTLSAQTDLQSALDGKASVREIKTSSFTAAINGRYTTSHASVKVVVTDPTGTTAGQIYSVLVGLGTMDFGSGTVYAASRMEIVRYFDGANWLTLTPTLSDNLTLNGTANTAPNQTAASNSSLMTRSLCDTRYANFLSSYLSADSAAVSNSTVYVDSGCSVTLSTGTWLVTSLIDVNTTTAGCGVRMQNSLAGGSSTTGNGFLVKGGGNQVGTIDDFSVASAAYNLAMVRGMLRSELIVFVTSGSPVFKTQFAQNVATVENTYAKKGSYILARKIA